jgi:hypothetical protein
MLICTPMPIAGWLSDNCFYSWSDSLKLVRTEMVVIAFLSAAISIPSLMFFEAPKSSAVIIRNLSELSGIHLLRYFLLKNRKGLEKYTSVVSILLS